MQSQLSQTQSQLTALQQEKANIERQVTALQQDKTNLQNQLTALQRDKSGVDAQVVQLQNTISSLNNQISSLQSQVSSLNGQISSLQSEVNNLRSIVNLQLSSSLLSQSTINLPTNTGRYALYQQQFSYAGYIQISYTATGNIYIEVESAGVSFKTQNSNTGSNIKVPVIPGQLWNVIVWNTDYFSAKTATITITYIY